MVAKNILALSMVNWQVYFWRSAYNKLYWLSEQVNVFKGIQKGLLGKCSQLELNNSTKDHQNEVKL
jgi:hypothetical protein